MNYDEIRSLPDPVQPVVREAEWSIWGRCPVTDENGYQCRWANVPHQDHYIVVERH